MTTEYFIEVDLMDEDAFQWWSDWHLDWSTLFYCDHLDDGVVVLGIYDQY